jgi:hypothetical protein
MMPLLELLVEEIAPHPVVLALAGRRQRGAQLQQQMLHRVAQARRPARRQPQQPRLARVGEIVDVAAVGRGRLGLGLAPDELLRRVWRPLPRGQSRKML